MTDIEELGRLVAEATKGSDELDARLRHALLAPSDAYVEKSEINGAWCIYRGEWGGRPKLFERPGNIPQTIWKGEYSRSIDAALALVERMLPGKWPSILRDALRDIAERHDWHITFPKPGQKDELPLAIIAALLNALSSIRPNGGAEE